MTLYAPASGHGQTPLTGQPWRDAAGALWAGGSTSSHRLWGCWPRLLALQNSKAPVRTDTERKREVDLSTHVVESNRLIESRQLRW